jgi:hypothetical protein
MTKIASVVSGERIADPLIELARCARRDRIVIAGAKGRGLMFELNRNGYHRVATTANCGLPDGQFDAALVDWHEHSIKALASTLDWLVHFLTPSGTLAVRIDSREPGASRNLALLLEGLHFHIEAGTRRKHDIVVAARRRDRAGTALAA